MRSFFDYVFILQECKSKHSVHTNLNGLAPQRQMGRGVPEIDLLVLTTCHKLLSTGMHIQAPQLISVTLSQRENRDQARNASFPSKQPVSGPEAMTCTWFDSCCIIYPIRHVNTHNCSCFFFTSGLFMFRWADIGKYKLQYGPEHMLFIIKGLVTRNWRKILWSCWILAKILLPKVI